ncbi:MAG: 50S ribosomal protein L11 [Candidatus Dormibacteria bacterium]
MGKKKVKAVLRLNVEAGKATPGYPIGPALGQHQVNIMEFCRAYNEKTQSQAGMVIPAEITIFEDRSFTFITKTPPTSDLIKKALGIEKGSAKPPREEAGELTREQALAIAKTKMPDLNAADPEEALKMVEGSARSMGVKVIG